ncbi:hypothetical protein D3C76_1105240 [compost metagenome]
MGGVQGLLDVFGRGAREFGDRLAVHRRGVGEVLTFHRGDELAADVVAVAGLEGNDSAGGTGLGVTHGVSPGSCVCWRERLPARDIVNRLSVAFVSPEQGLGQSARSAVPERFSVN